MKTLNLPERVSIVGRIANVKFQTPEDNGLFSRDTDIVTVEDSSKKKHVLYVGNTMANSFGKRHLLFEGNFVSFDVDICIADTTQYELDGDVFFHTEDFNSVRDFFNASEDEVRNFLYPDALQSSFAANSKIFVGVEPTIVAQIAADTANKAIESSIARLIAKRNEHTITDAEKGTPRVSRKDNLQALIAEIDTRLEKAPAALKPTLTAKRERLLAQLEEA